MMMMMMVVVVVVVVACDSILVVVNITDAYCGRKFVKQKYMGTIQHFTAIPGTLVPCWSVSQLSDTTMITWERRMISTKLSNSDLTQELVTEFI